MKEKRTVNLVVHLKEIEFLFRQTNHEVFKDALDEIGEILNLPNTFRLDSYDFGSIKDLIGNASLVILYGCNRNLCLESASDEIMKTGAYVAFNIRGTI